MTRSSRRSTGALVLAALGFAGILSAGCQSSEMRREPVSTDQVLQMVSQGRPPEEIIRKIRESRTVYFLHARDVKELLDRGVPESVIDEMLQTRVREAELSSPYYGPYYYPYYYGPHVGIGYGVAF